MYKQDIIYILGNSSIVQSTARQTIQNCQTSPVDFQPSSIDHRAQI
jgi:hypothetical protein